MEKEGRYSQRNSHFPFSPSLSPSLDASLSSLAQQMLTVCQARCRVLGMSAREMGTGCPHAVHSSPRYHRNQDARAAPGKESMQSHGGGRDAPLRTPPRALPGRPWELTERTSSCPWNWEEAGGLEPRRQGVWGQPSWRAGQGTESQARLGVLESTVTEGAAYPILLVEGGGDRRGDRWCVPTGRLLPSWVRDDGAGSWEWAELGPTQCGNIQGPVMG